MPSDAITSEGITIQTRTELVDSLVASLKAIYGDDINLESNSPDAQLVQIFSQASYDLRELIVSVYNNFDPDKAVGRVLDARCAINGVYRNAGTYTTVVVNVTVDRGLFLPGLDNYRDSEAFTVSDSTGNKFSLVATTAVTSGTHALPFQCTELGSVTVAANALTIISTPTLGVTGVTNPGAATDVGTDEETDAALRLRRERALAIPAKGSYDSLLSAVVAVDGVAQATVYENPTNTTDANGIAPHGIWVVVDDGDNDEVAAAIYSRRPLGTPTKGSVTVSVPQSDGSVLPISFSRPTPERLYLNLVLSSTDGLTIDYKALGYRLIDAMSYRIGAKADTAAIVVMLRSLQSNVNVADEGVSLTAGSYAAQVSPSKVDRQFYLSDTSITINGTLLNAL